MAILHESESHLGLVIQVSHLFSLATSSLANGKGCLTANQQRFYLVEFKANAKWTRSSHTYNMCMFVCVCVYWVVISATLTALSTIQRI